MADVGGGELGGPVFCFAGSKAQLTMSLGADCWAQDLVEVVFAKAMLNNAALTAAASWAVTTVSPWAQPVTVRRAYAGRARAVTRVFLVVTPHTPGGTYTVTGSGFTASDGSALVTASGVFLSRLTKIDSLVRSRPPMYDVSPGTLHREILNVIGRSDDLIAGSRHDFLG